MACVLAASATMLPRGGWAADEPPGQPTAARRTAAVAAALFPGLLLHGSGHFVLGERRTARRLLAAEGIGLGTLVGGLGILAATGASRRTTGLVIPVMAGGGLLFSGSALADLYGSARPGDAVGSPIVTPARLEGEVGLRAVRDPTFAYGALAVQELTVRAGRWRATPSLWWATGEANRRTRLEAAYRLFGPSPSTGSEPPGGEADPVRDGSLRDGSTLEVLVAGTHHRYGPEGFSLATGEAALAGRRDLAFFAPTLRGSFVEGAVGYALGAQSYDSGAQDAVDLLLARFAFGFYLGDPRGGGRAGEILVGYDHRHDGYAAGLKLTGLGSGPLGHFLVQGRWWFGRHLGVLFDGAVGSAWLGGASLLIRSGGGS